MGRGDNRRTLKARRRKAWRKLKDRIKKKIESGKAKSKLGGDKKKAAPAAARTTVTRTKTT